MRRKKVTTPPKGQMLLTSCFTPSSSEVKLTKESAPYAINTAVLKKLASGKYIPGKVVEVDISDQTYQIKLEEGPDEKWTTTELQWGVFLESKIGTHVAKHFLADDTDSSTRQLFYGQVVDVIPLERGELTPKMKCYFRVHYEDGDSEDFDMSELTLGSQLYRREKTRKRAAADETPSDSMASPPPPTKKTKKQKGQSKETKSSVARKNPKAVRSSPRKKQEPTSYEDASSNSDAPVEPPSSSRTSRGRQGRRIVTYDEGDSMSESEEAPVTRKPSSRTAKPSKPLVISASDSEFDSPVAEDDDTSLDDMSVEMEEPKPKRATSKSQTAKKETPKPKISRKKSSGTESSENLQAELKAKLKKEKNVYNPLNNPQKLLKDGSYVDPVGIDPTHGIVEGIISRQINKVGGLLQLAVKEDPANRDIGELEFPLRLSTACSGTDAPSIAMSLWKESLDKIMSPAEHGFSYQHDMSCEIEPFKQAYISRNFPGVLLFPDITKLTESPEVLDVYGRPQKLPEAHLFVAGTSCKDFSMLKTRDRQDIEDKGTSGETFLAAVEFLDVQQPPTAIFENVDGAPWGKMQEYIRGRINLADRNVTKAIKDASKKADADNELLFSVNEDGHYVAEAIPRQVGIRAGSVVEGVVRAGNDASDVEPLCAGSKAKSEVTLKQLAYRHKIDLDADILVFRKKANYCTHLCKVDTKEYGLPQTRNRKYLYIWKSDDPDDDLGEYFQEILDHLKTPLLHSMDAFLLPDTHDRIRCFREALRSGPGLLVKRERAQETDFWDWELSHVQDLPRHMAFREKNGIDERARWLTGWSTRGNKEVAPGLWPELLDCWNHRRLDMVDCFAAAAVRDAVSRDPMHHLFTWDLSQNVTRAPFRTATVGVSGCITPGGEIIMPHRGRTLMGYEKLLLQGIPFSRLMLGAESEVQLSDLAGNAMSVPVVSATMLAAICAPQLRRQRQRDRGLLLTSMAFNAKYDNAKGKVIAERGDRIKGDANESVVEFDDVLPSLVNLADEAYRSSVLCLCESSGTQTKAKLLECAGCGMGICHGCTDRHQIKSHVLKAIPMDTRVEPPIFERRLRAIAPPLLHLDGVEDLEDGDALDSYTFRILDIIRKVGYWELVYGAWEDHGSGRQVAEIRIHLGKLGRLSPNGLSVFVRCFAPAIRQDKPMRGRLLDSARRIVGLHDKSDWEVREQSISKDLMIVGSEPCDSQRVNVGLNDTAEESLRNHKVASSHKPNIESRNSLIKYPSLWKKWPGTIEVSGDDRVAGTYKKIPCQHTTVHSALWRSDDIMGKPRYMYFRPDAIRTSLDVAVFATTPSYKDETEFCELIDWIPENSLDSRHQRTKATFLEWKPACNLKLQVPAPLISIETNAKSFEDQIKEGTEAPILCRMKGLNSSVVGSLLESAEGTEIDLLGALATKNAKLLSILIAPQLLKFAAEEKLSLRMSCWSKLPAAEFGLCSRNVPVRPMEKWREVSNKAVSHERYYDTEESKEYYKQLRNRPNAFIVKVDPTALEICMNPSVAAHRAAALLGVDKTTASQVEVEFCLTEMSSMGEPDALEFHVPNSDGFKETAVPTLALPLYSRQARALTRMLKMECGEVAFSEEERSEHILPGVGWCLISKAARKRPLRGGVLADAIGSGKTVVVIALILARVEEARRNCDVGKGRSSATLIVVPPGLVRQWDDERKKFTKSLLKCITIDSTETLKRYSVEDLCTADMVIVPAAIIEEAPKTGPRRLYTEHLSKMAKADKIPPAPTHYSQREAPTIEGTWVRNMASGPEIYVGNKGNQRTRDAQAFYGYRYAEAIKKLREQSFKPSDRGVPLEYFTWERLIIDECHETLVTGKSHETKAADFKEKARRGAREFLGVSQTDVSQRPLQVTSGIWGLTGTPLLETEARVTELASLMGGTYVTGAAHHWRREERDSGRDLFLNQQEPTRSREYRCAVQESCHTYVREACQRNRGEKLLVQLSSEKHPTSMAKTEGDDFLRNSPDANKSFGISPNELGDQTSKVLAITSASTARQAALLDILSKINDDDPSAKVLVFANPLFGGYDAALKALEKRLKDSANATFCRIDDSSPVAEQNEIFSWFRRADASEEDRQRPRVLLLSFEQAAGHNLQESIHEVVFFDPMYSGTDAVADASVEEQAIGRVFRQGQRRDVRLTRIVLRGPEGERCVDDWMVDRNTNEEVLRAATSNFD
eukprot:Nitzschia sp. Nitz4//scaffold16_size188269//113894//121049//NITZ4_001800-RA/size188269-processed-gene-0.61-mRNA-1//1//CDS//3329538544//1526//frame0